MILVRIRADDKGSVAVDNLAKKAKAAELKIMTLGDTIKTAFGTAAAYIGLRQAGNALMYLTKNANEYALALKKIEVVGGVPIKYIKEFDEVSKKLADTTEHSAKNIALAGLEIVRMGYDVNKTKKVLPDALNLATFAGEDLQWSATNMINVMKAFRIDSSKSAKVSDVMSLALNKTSLNLKDLMEGYTYVAPIAENLNYSFEETTALLGFLADISIRGSHGGTSLKNTMLKLLDPTERVAGALKDVNLDGARLVDILKLLKDKGISVQAMFKQFDIRALTAALAIGDNADYIKNLIRILEEDIGGAAEKGANEIRKAYHLMWQNLRNQIELAGIALNESLGNEQGTLIENLKEKVKELTDHIYRNKNEIKDLAHKFNNLLNVALDLTISLTKTLSQNWGYLIAGLAVAEFSNLAIQITNLAKDLGLIDAKFKNIRKTQKTTSQAISNIASSISLITTAAIAAKIGIDLLIERWDNWITKSSEKFAKDNTSKEMLARLKTIKESYEKIKQMQESNQVNYIAFSLLGADYYKVNPEYEKAVKENRKLILDYQKEYEAGLITSQNYERSWVKNLETVTKHYDNLQKTLGIVNKKKEEFNEIDDKNKDKRARGDKEDEDERRKKIMEKISQSGVFGALDTTVGEVESYKAKTGEYNGLIYDLFFGKNFDQETEDAFSQITNFIDDTTKKLKEESSESFADKVAKSQEQIMHYMETERQAKFDSAQESINITTSVNDIIMNLSDQKTQRIIENLEVEKEALAERYEMEDSLSEEKSQFEILRERKRAAEQAKIDKEIEQRKKEQAKRDVERQIVQATANLASAIISTMSQTYGGPFTKIAGGLAVAAAGGAYIAELSSLDWGVFREGTNYYGGEGNETSDSNIARISKGEMIIKSGEVKRAGGPDRINRLIDSPYSSSEKNVNVYVQYGRKEFIREIIPIIKHELSRH